MIECQEDVSRVQIWFYRVDTLEYRYIKKISGN